MTTDVKFDQLSQIKTGVDKLANAVKSTLGPGGKGVIIKKKSASPYITKDGVTVAQNIFLDDPIEDMGAQLIKEVANKTVEGAGDGTTTATILAQAIFNKGLNEIQSGANPVDIKKGIDIAVKKAVEHIKSVSVATKDQEKIASVATISANYDAEIGKMIAEAVIKVGDNGFITAEESNGTETYVKITEGMQLERGYLSPHFITNPERLTVEFQKPYILVTDKRVNTMQDLLPVLEMVANEGRSLLIIAEDVEAEALATLVINKNRGAVSVCAIRCPYMAGQKKLLMDDIATATGATVISEEAGFLLQKISPNMLGSCDSVTISKDNTVIVNGHGDKESISKRVAQLKSELTACTDEYEKMRLKARLAKIDGGVAIVHVGGFTETEMKERKFRVDDAIYATIAAMEEGIVPGGGITFLDCIPGIITSIGFSDNDDEAAGIKVVIDSLRQPIKTLCENSGTPYKDVLTTIRMNKHSKKNYGWNARNDTYGDMIDMGIIDPAKVLRLSLENAASIAGVLLNTKAVVCEKIKE